MGELLEANPIQKGEPWQVSITSIQEKWNYILQHELFTDITFKVGPSEELISCHRIMLVMNSPVFETMLSHRWNKLSDGMLEIPLPEEDPVIFRIFLKFLYSNEMDTSVENITSILILAKKYLCSQAIAKSIQVLKCSLKERIAIQIYQTAQMSDEKELEKAAEEYILNNAENLARIGEFSKFSESNLCYFITHDELNVAEIELFNAVYEWGKAECGRNGLDANNSENVADTLKDILPLIRFPLMSSEEFSCEVVTKNILPLKETVDVFRYLTTPASKRNDGEPQMDIKFNTKGRTRKIYSYVFQRLKGHGYDFGRKWQNICFQVDQDIKLVSLGFFRAIQPEASLQVGVRIQDFDLGVIYAEVDESVKCSANEDVFHVKFPQPVKIAKDVDYTVSYVIKGKETFYRTEGPPKITLNCGAERKVNFWFKEAKSDTDLDQVPEICFRL